MGKRGPAKQPQRLLEMKGTAQKCRHRAEVAMVGEKITDIAQVTDLCDFDRLTERGQRVFLRQCEFLISLKVLQATDLDALVLYAENYDMALKCMANINKQAWFKPKYDDAGQQVGWIDNPYLKQFDKICKTINSIGTQYGFTPASRMRLSVEVKEEKHDIFDIATDTDVIEI